MFVNMYKKAFYVISRKPIMLWGLTLLSGIISILASIMTATVPVLTFIVSYLLACGMTLVYIDGLHGKQVCSDQLFGAFNKNWLRIAGGMAWKDLWIVIWALVPIAGPIIAIVKGYSYKFVPYILMTKPEVTATQALKLSMRMTYGKKMDMFLADLCFYGAFAIASIVLALLAAIPFIGTVFALISFLVGLAFALFSSIFVGLYQAAFYVDANVRKAAPNPAPAATQL